MHLTSAVPTKTAEQVMASRWSASSVPPPVPYLGDGTLSKVAFEVSHMLREVPKVQWSLSDCARMFCTQSRKDLELHPALNDFTPPDLHSRCRAETAMVVKAHTHLVKSLAIKKEIFELEHSRKDRDITRLQVELEEMGAKNTILEAQLNDAIDARSACDIKVSLLTDEHLRERSALRAAHARQLEALRDAHVEELAEQHAAIEAAEKRKYATFKGMYFRDMANFSKTTGALRAELVALRQDYTARIDGLRAQLNAAEQSALVQTGKIIVSRLLQGLADEH